MRTLYDVTIVKDYDVLWSGKVIASDPNHARTKAYKQFRKESGHKCAIGNTNDYVEKLKDIPSQSYTGTNAWNRSWYPSSVAA